MNKSLSTPSTLLFQKVLKKITPGLAVALAPIYVLVVCWRSGAVAPTAAYVTPTPPSNLNGINVYSGKTPKGAASNSTTLSRYKDNLKIPANGSYANLGFRGNKGDMGLKVKAYAHNGTLTTYFMPCNLNVSSSSTVVIQWENQGGFKKNGRGCEEGMRISSSASLSTLLPTSEATDLAQANKSLELSQAEDRVRYYCSAVVESGQGPSGISTGATSIDSACSEAMQKCQSKNNGGECAIATMGEWNIDDQSLTMSLKCEDKPPNAKKVSGSEINSPSSGNDLLQELLKKYLGEIGGLIGRLLGNKEPNSCVVEVYPYDEIVVSPVTSGQTTVQTTGGDGGVVKVHVVDGEALIRSTSVPSGIKVAQGQGYTFDGNGNLRYAGNRNELPPYRTPSRSPSPTPTLYP